MDKTDGSPLSSSVSFVSLNSISMSGIFQDSPAFMFFFFFLLRKDDSLNVKPKVNLL